MGSVTLGTLHYPGNDLIGVSSLLVLLLASFLLGVAWSRRWAGDRWAGRAALWGPLVLIAPLALTSEMRFPEGPDATAVVLASGAGVALAGQNLRFAGVEHKLTAVAFLVFHGAVVVNLIVDPLFWWGHFGRELYWTHPAIAVAMWTWTIGMLGLGIHGGVRERRRARAERAWLRGLCVRCGYDLRGSGERCPECGTVATMPERLRPFLHR